MNRKILGDIVDDLRIARDTRGIVVYLEGKTDLPVLLALLGAQDVQSTARGVLFDGVLIRALGGSRDVERRLEVARDARIAGIFGVIDGDGEALAALALEFDEPYGGPRFRWKGYCIENLLTRAVWPAEWGARPDWSGELAKFAPYVAINRLWSDLGTRLNRVGLDRFINPARGQLRSAEDFLRVLRAGKDELVGLEVDAMFSRQVHEFLQTLTASVDEAHALVNGKWLIDHFAARCTPATQERCREEWTACLRAAGGDPEVRAWWRRAVAP